MNRKDFLTQLWKRFIMPMVTLTVIYFILKYLIVIVNTDGALKAIGIFFMILAILYFTANVIGQLTNSIKDKIYLKLSEKAKFNLNVLKKVFEFISVLVLGAMLYNSWMKDAFFASIAIFILLASYINGIITEQRKLTQD